MFTPQEVKEKSFAKSTFGGGYNMAAVDEFLDTLTEDYSALYTENNSLKSKLKMLAEKVEEYRATEDAMRSTLLAAQRLAAQTVQEAQTQKEQMLAEAQAKNKAELQRMQNEVDEMHQRMSLARQELENFVNRSRELCEQQADFFRRLPEMDMTILKDIQADVAAAQAAEEEAASTAAEEEKPQAEETAAESEEAPAEEPSEEESKVKIPPFPTDLNLDTTELKFGPNYGNN